MPMFERMVVVLEAAATATDDAKAAAKQGFADAEEKLLSVVGMSTELFEVAARPLLAEAKPKRTDGRTRQRPPARPDSAQRPPHVTRGSGTPNDDRTLTLPEIPPLPPLPKAIKRASKPSKAKGRG